MFWNDSFLLEVHKATFKNDKKWTYLELRNLEPINALFEPNFLTISFPTDFSFFCSKGEFLDFQKAKAGLINSRLTRD